LKRLLTLLLTIFIFSIGNTQSYYFGPKIGPSIGLQQWNSFERDPLFAYHGAFFIESYGGEESTSSLFAQLGYHIRGSSIFDRFNSFAGTRNKFEFRNVALQLGAKMKIPGFGNKKAYYLFAVRFEYTVNTNLVAFEPQNAIWPIYPFEVYVNKLNYGVNIGGGWEFPADKFFIPFIEINISPDLSLQYEQPPLGNFTNPNTGQNFNLPDRSIRNLTFEISVGIKFFREIKYID
jgi:hypothetical protein